MLYRWHVIFTDINTGEVVHEEEKDNLVVDTGRADILNLIFGLSASSVMIAGGVGASATAADYTDTRLTHELIYDSSRKLLTNTSGVSLTSSDVVLDPTVIGSCTFREKIVVQYVYEAPDANDGNQFAEFGLFSSTALPATPTSTSGVMLNHLVISSPFTKSASLTCTVRISIYC